MNNQASPQTPSSPKWADKESATKLQPPDKKHTYKAKATLKQLQNHFGTLLGKVVHDEHAQQWKVKTDGANQWFNLRTQKTKKGIYDPKDDKSVDEEISSFKTDKVRSQSSRLSQGISIDDDTVLHPGMFSEQMEEKIRGWKERAVDKNKGGTSKSENKKSKLKVKAVGVTNAGTAYFTRKLTPHREPELERADKFTFANRKLKFYDNSGLPLQKQATMYADENKNHYRKMIDYEAKNWRRQRDAFEKVMMAKEVETRQVTHEWYIIKTTSTAFQVWKLLIITMSFVTSFTYAYYAAFLDLMSQEEVDGLAGQELFFTALFTIDIVVNFLTEYHVPMSTEVITDVRKIAAVYMRGRFFWDLLSVLPFRSMFPDLPLKYSKLFYLNKLSRLYNGYVLLNYKIYVKEVKDIIAARIQKILKEDPERANSSDEDNARIVTVIYAKNLFHAIQVVILLLTVSFLLGQFWFIYCQFTMKTDEEVRAYPDANNENFLTYFKMYTDSGDTNSERTVKLTYFAFTTLSTVGFGDYHPRSDYERAAIVFIVLFGVNLTTFIMDVLNRLIRELQSFNKDYDESSELSVFFKVLQRFNEDEPLQEGWIEELQNYFFYRWGHNKNQAISAEADYFFLEQLHFGTQSRIYTQYLFKDFLQKYGDHFKQDDRDDDSVWTEIDAGIEHLNDLESNNHLDFLTSLLKFMEPQYFDFGTLIQRQNETIEQIIFVMNCKFRVGYNHMFLLMDLYKTESDLINEKMANKGLPTSQDNQDPLTHTVTEPTEALRQQLKQSKIQNPLKPLLFMHINKYCTEKIYGKGKKKSYKQKNIKKFHYPLLFDVGQQPIGLFNCLYNVKSKYLYLAVRSKEYPDARRCDCFFIRKKNWGTIYNELSEEPTMARVVREFKKNALDGYKNRIFDPILSFQRRRIEIESRIKIHEDERRLTCELEGFKSEIGRHDSFRGFNVDDQNDKSDQNDAQYPFLESSGDEEEGDRTPGDLSAHSRPGGLGKLKLMPNKPQLDYPRRSADKSKKDTLAQPPTQASKPQRQRESVQGPVRNSMISKHSAGGVAGAGAGAAGLAQGSNSGKTLLESEIQRASQTESHWGEGQAEKRSLIQSDDVQAMGYEIKQIFKRKREVDTNRLVDLYNAVDQEGEESDGSSEDTAEVFEHIDGRLEAYEKLVTKVIRRYEDCVKKLRIEKAKNKLLEKKLLAYQNIARKNNIQKQFDLEIDQIISDMEQNREARTNLYMPLQEAGQPPEDKHFSNMTLPSIQEEEQPRSPEQRRPASAGSSSSISNIMVNGEEAGEGSPPKPSRKQISVAGIPAVAVPVGKAGNSSASVESRTSSSGEAPGNPRREEGKVKGQEEAKDELGLEVGRHGLAQKFTFSDNSPSGQADVYDAPSGSAVSPAKSQLTKPNLHIAKQEAKEQETAPDHDPDHATVPPFKEEEEALDKKDMGAGSPSLLRNQKFQLAPKVAVHKPKLSYQTPDKQKVIEDEQQQIQKIQQQNRMISGMLQDNKISFVDILKNENPDTMIKEVGRREGGVDNKNAVGPVEKTIEDNVLRNPTDTSCNNFNIMSSDQIEENIQPIQSYDSVEIPTFNLQVSPKARGRHRGLGRNDPSTKRGHGVLGGHVPEGGWAEKRLQESVENSLMDVSQEQGLIDRDDQ